MFWRAMRPSLKSNAGSEPKGLLFDAIKRDFGSVEKFKTGFDEAGAKLFGSGWVWLVRTRQEDSKLEVITTSGHDHPMMQDRFPILLNDVWEHAYYLKYESRRPDYLKAWWEVVDWDEAARLFDLADNSAEELWEGEGGNILEPKIEPKK
jgi:Fe-Mn family superoxide dismutase